MFGNIWRKSQDGMETRLDHLSTYDIPGSILEAEDKTNIIWMFSMCQ